MVGSSVGAVTARCRTEPGDPDLPTDIAGGRPGVRICRFECCATVHGGVACEIDNVRRASNGILPRDCATEQEKAVHELCAQATQRAGVRVTVDVIAGTSAGGLNGVLLATAIARGRPGR